MKEAGLPLTLTFSLKEREQQWASHYSSHVCFTNPAVDRGEGEQTRKN